MSDQESPESQPASLREILLVAGTMGAIAFAYLQFWHLPRNREMAALQKQVVEAKKKLESDLAAADELTRKANADPVEQAADAQMDRVREMNSNFANIVRELSGGDTPDLFTIKSLNLAKEEKMADYSKVLFNLELEAPFLSVGQFLERLEKSDLLTEVVSVDVTRVQPEMKRCTIKLSLYSYAARL